jgi:mRNA-degrading endonuclease YafQ of YafQ-DinJ toxin-antitoxin module
MRTIERTNAFRLDFKRVKLQPRHRDVDAVPVLIYRKPEVEVLQLVRLGSHSDLGL